MAGEIDSYALGIIVRCLTFEISERTCNQLFSLLLLFQIFENRPLKLWQIKPSDLSLSAVEIRLTLKWNLLEHFFPMMVSVIHHAKWSGFPLFGSGLWMKCLRKSLWNREKQTIEWKFMRCTFLVAVVANGFQCSWKLRKRIFHREERVRRLI